jgi:hypothetical protein
MTFRDQSAVTRECDLVCPLVLHHELVQGRAGSHLMAARHRAAVADSRAWRRSHDGARIAMMRALIGLMSWLQRKIAIWSRREDAVARGHRGEQQEQSRQSPSQPRRRNQPRARRHPHRHVAQDLRTEFIRWRSCVRMLAVTDTFRSVMLTGA